MNIEVIEHFEILTKYHCMDMQEALIISNLTKDGYCVFLETKDDNSISDWHVYNKMEGLGQLISGNNFKSFKNNNYESED